MTMEIFSILKIRIEKSEHTGKWEEKQTETWQSKLFNKVISQFHKLFISIYTTFSYCNYCSLTSIRNWLDIDLCHPISWSDFIESQFDFSEMLFLFPFIEKYFYSFLNQFIKTMIGFCE